MSAGAATLTGRILGRRLAALTTPEAATPGGCFASLAVLMEAILSGLQVILAVVVIVLILLHSGKDAGLSGAFGVGTGAGPFGGGSLVERNLNRWTIFFALLFVANVIVLLKI
jgi:preprotein translocase subunit SecG